MSSKTDVTLLSQGKCLLETAEKMAASLSPAQAKAAFVAAIDLRDNAETRNAFGCYLLRIGEHSEAIEQFDFLLATAKNQEDRELESIAANNLAAVYRGMNDFEQAARFQQQSLAIRLELGVEGDDDQFSADLTNRANDAILSGDLHLAEQLVRRSLELEIDQKSISGQAADWGTLGLILGLQGDLSTGIRFLWEAYRLHLQLDDDFGTGCDLMNIAELACKMGRLREAANLLGRAVWLLDRAGADELYSKAIRCLDRAEQLAAVRDRDPLLN